MKPVKRHSRSREDRAPAVAAVRAVYADLAARPAVRGCLGRSECCRFRLTGRLPFLTRGEALVAARAWRATGRKTLPEIIAADGACPLLDPATARCRIYADRPFACRTHFCREAGGIVPRADVLDLIRRLEAISAGLPDGDGAPRPLPAAVAAELSRV